ncbi:MAG: hypothetical protein EAZ12_08210 [Sphingobacteriia bacterium]|nr:MAG: hypothetical protein EAZ12_08210 [Sphingobacteriia bacterium]
MNLYLILLITFLAHQNNDLAYINKKNTSYLDKKIPVVVAVRGGKNSAEMLPLEYYLNDKLKKNNYIISTLENAMELMKSEIEQYVKLSPKKSITSENIVEESMRTIKNMPATYQKLIFRLVLNDAKKIDSCFFQVIYSPNGIRLPKNGGYLHDSLLQNNDLKLLLDCVYDSVTIKR